MADNVDVTPGTGKTVRTREDGSNQRQVVIEEELTFASSNGTAITTATDTQAIAAPGAGTQIEVWRIHASNSGVVPVVVSFRESGGTKLFETYLPQNGVMSLKLNGDWVLAANTALDINTSAAGSVYWTIGYKSIT